MEELSKQRKYQIVTRIIERGEYMLTQERGPYFLCNECAMLLSGISVPFGPDLYPAFPEFTHMIETVGKLINPTFSMSANEAWILNRPSKEAIKKWNISASSTPKKDIQFRINRMRELKEIVKFL